MARWDRATYVCILVFSEQSALVIQRRAECFGGGKLGLLEGELPFKGGLRRLWTKAQRVEELKV